VEASHQYLAQIHRLLNLLVIMAEMVEHPLQPLVVVGLVQQGQTVLAVLAVPTPQQAQL
jgi:hypothetical protein